MRYGFLVWGLFCGVCLDDCVRYGVCLFCLSMHALLDCMVFAVCYCLSVVL